MTTCPSKEAFDAQHAPKNAETAEASTKKKAKNKRPAEDDLDEASDEDIEMASADDCGNQIKIVQVINNTCEFCHINVLNLTEHVSEDRFEEITGHKPNKRSRRSKRPSKTSTSSEGRPTTHTHTYTCQAHQRPRESKTLPNPTLPKLLSHGFPHSRRCPPRFSPPMPPDPTRRTMCTVEQTVPSTAPFLCLRDIRFPSQRRQVLLT